MFTERHREIISILSNSGYVLFYTLFLIYGSKESFEQSWNAISSIFFFLTLIFYIIMIPTIFFWGIFAYQKQQKKRFVDDLSLSISVHGFAKTMISLTLITFLMTISTIIIIVAESVSERNILFWITLSLASIVTIPSFVLATNVSYLKILERKRKSDLSDKIENVRKQGFTSIFEKEKASTLGFEDSESWYDFLSSGYETKEEWETAKVSKDK